MKAQEFINHCRANGQYSFSLEETEKTLALPKAQILNALHRLKQKKLIVSPAKGFYLIVPPEYQAFGCLPADMFVPALMQHLHQPYYVSFLSAAQFYGAAHQKPQQFQLVTLKNHRPIQCGRVYITFTANKNVTRIPTKRFNTPAGTIEVATPEVLALDLVGSIKQGAGINNVATVLIELAENIDTQQLIKLTKINSELFWVQRLGYLLEFLGFNQLANALLKTICNKNLHWVKLVSNPAYKNLGRDRKWKIIINTKVEPDE